MHIIHTKKIKKDKTHVHVNYKRKKKYKTNNIKATKDPVPQDLINT